MTRVELKKRSDLLRGKLEGMKVLTPAGTATCAAHCVLQAEQDIRDELHGLWIDYWANGAIEELSARIQKDLLAALREEREARLAEEAKAHRAALLRETYPWIRGKRIARSLLHSRLIQTLISVLLLGLLVRMGVPVEKAAVLLGAPRMEAAANP
jgi:hypothetical protein